jgi:membrane protease YdiL (CAAX protease family)
VSGFLTVLAAVMNTLFVILGIYIYVSLIRQIAARTQVETGEGERTFGLPEVVLAVALAALFTLNITASSGKPGTMVLRTQDLIANGLVSVALMLIVAALLRIRGMSVSALAGFNKLGFWRTLLTGGILLLASYPLIFLADLATRRFLGGDSSRQGIVEMFTGSQTLQQRVFIIILAVAVAPMVEEFVFRFFFYGVVRRYLGRAVGLVANSMLFAAVHAHVPSAVPLFVLGICFTLAYEWSGSILVPMAMHALFNSLTLTFLAFPELLPQ